MKNDEAIRSSPLRDARWIWLSQARPKVNQYVCFRKSFSLRRVSRRAVLDISADSDFILYLNGHEVGRGQFTDWPRDKTFTRFEAGRMLRRGGNVLAVLAYHVGASFGTYRKGKPGLIVGLSAGAVTVVTDETWRAVEHPAYRSGPMPLVTKQLGFTYEYDARREMDWHQPSFPDGRWERARVLAGATDGFWRRLEPRPVSPLRTEPPIEVRIVAQGSFRRRRRRQTTALTMMDDALVCRMPDEVFRCDPLIDELNYAGPPPNPGQRLRPDGEGGLVVLPPGPGLSGQYVIVDVGSERVGLLLLDVDAPAGTVAEIAHGEHLDDGRVRAAVGGRNFADRIVCRSRRHRFTMPFRRLGGRYLQLHLSGFKRPVRLRYLGLRPTVLPLQRMGSFRTHDPLAEQIQETAVRTLQLCMHDHYEDCPWREQCLYAYDSRVQALCGYYALGNHAFAAASLDLLGRGLRSDGLLELCAPAKVHVNVPIFSFVWIAALAEHWLFSGNAAVFRSNVDTARTIVEGALARFDARSGLYGLPQGDDIWHFYEWTPGLANLARDRAGAGEDHAGYNLYLHEALEALTWMLANSGDRAEARRLRRLRKALGAAIHRAFFDTRRGLYASRRKGGRLRDGHEHIQALALHEGIVPAAARRGLLSRLERRDLPRSTLVSLIYLVRSLMVSGPRARKLASRIIAEHWHPMALQGATSFWETRHGADDFNYAGSLCHGWSALPVYYHQAHVLGVQPLEAGFERFAISPYPDRFYEVSGTVPTPRGRIHVAWRRGEDGLIIKARGPSSLQPVVKALPEAKVKRATYNGKHLNS